MVMLLKHQITCAPNLEINPHVTSSCELHAISYIIIVINCNTEMYIQSRRCAAQWRTICKLHPPPPPPPPA